jgi:hypothetical protein
MTAVDILTSIFSDWRVAVLAGLVLVAFIWSGRNRVIWEKAWNASRYQSIPIPERCWSYDARYLEDFARAADHVRIGHRSALHYYTVNILRLSDIAFAVTLATVTAFIWYELAVSHLTYDWVRWAAFPCGAMAVLYGIADVSENLKLSTILRHWQKVDRADAAATNMLTRVKVVSISLSIIGGAIFLVISAAELIAERLTRRRQPEQAPARN